MGYIFSPSKEVSTTLSKMGVWSVDAPLRLHDKKLMNAPSFKEFHLKKFTDPPVSRSSIENCRGKAPAIFP